MKKYFAVLMILFFVCFAGTAFAWSDNTYNSNYDNTYNYGGVGGQGGQGGAGGSAIQGQGQAQAIVGSGNSSVGNGFGNFSPKAEATIEKGAITNTNTNTNSVKNEVDNKNYNTNLNSNSAKQDQKQAQGQLQGQGQGQGQKQSANNEGNTQTIIQIYEDKRDLVAPPPVPMVDPKLTAAKAGSIKVKGSLWLHVKSITLGEVDTMLPEMFGADTKQDVRALSKGAATDKIVLADKAIGQYVATIYVISTGADMIACEAIAIKEAMKIGGTHIVKTDADFKVTSQGKSWGLGLGGGASMFGHDDTITIAPSGGFGYGVADASNESLPQAAFTVYVDKSVKKTALEGPSVTGNFRGAGYQN